MKVHNLSKLSSLGLYSGVISNLIESFESELVVYRFNIGSLKFKLKSSSALVLIDNLFVSVYASPDSSDSDELEAFGILNRSSKTIINEKDIIKKINDLSKINFIVLFIQFLLAALGASILASTSYSESIIAYVILLAIGSAFFAITYELLKLNKNKIELKSALELLALSVKDIK